MAFVQVSTENPLGNRPLNLMARQQSLGWLSYIGAAPTPGDYDNNQAVLGQLVAMGAISQDDANEIWGGNASLDDMAVNMTMINQALALTGQMGAQTVQPLPPSTSTPLTLPAAGSSVPTVPAVTTPQTAAAPQIPPGSTILYTATFNPVPAFLTANALLTALAPLLPAHGMSLISSSVAASGVTSAAAFSASILDSVGNALQSDAKSVLDALVNQISKNSLMQSTIAVTSAGMNPGGTPNPAAPSVTTFLENNAMMLAFLALGIVALPALIKKM